MKEDILEQVVEDYLQCLGYFTIHNVKYRPDTKGPYRYCCQRNRRNTQAALTSWTVFSRSARSWASQARTLWPAR